MSDNLDTSKEQAKKEFLKLIGQQIRKAREEKGLSAAEFGRKAFMERSHIARIEGGNTNPTVITLRTICNALDIEFEELFKGFKFRMSEKKENCD